MEDYKLPAFHLLVVSRGCPERRRRLYHEYTRLEIAEAFLALRYEEIS